MASRTNHPQVVLGAGKFGDPKLPTVADVKYLTDLFRNHNGIRLDTAAVYLVEELEKSESLLSESGQAASFKIDTKLSTGDKKLHSRENVLKSTEGSLKGLEFAGKDAKGQVDNTYLHMA